MADGGSRTGSQQASVVQLTPNEEFFRYFQHEITDIQNKIERLSSHGNSGGERADAVEHCLASISRLSDEVKDASSQIPAYDQRTYGEAIKALTTKLADARATFAPRAKFSFRSGGPVFTAQKNESAISLNDAAALARDRRQKLPGYGSDVSNCSSFANTPAHRQSPAPAETEKSDGDGAESNPAPSSSGQNQQDYDGDAVGEASRPEASKIRQPSFSQSTSVNISNHDGKHIVLPASAAPATQSSGTLANLRRCVIDMCTPTTTTTTTSFTSPTSARLQSQHQPQHQPFAGGLTLRNITSSLIICGRVAGAVHATRLSNTTLVVVARQFRMHDARNCDVYLSCASKPIIEDCSGIRFAPLPEAYRGCCGLASTSIDDQGLEKVEVERKDGENESWRDVQDFKWLNTREPSPNWRVLLPEERVKEEVWRDTVPGGPGLGRGDVLKAVGIQE